jgi:hypothetical protein
VRGDDIFSDLHMRLLELQLPSGGWSFGNSPQPVLEPTCLALLALQASRAAATDRGIRFLLRCQNKDGSWPTFAGDDPTGVGQLPWP